ncbi:MAG: hypothetical protein SP4CHLAM5_07110 [Chlamydiia bacterium]|nr:hypothetical protein [Chlamydiia bacterium]MCH9618578.1 hypothetical protein [Chlamydiia bacterium]MCH9623883.1 hypothetical protein [Chlamydiia bacterium]
MSTNIKRLSSLLLLISCIPLFADTKRSTSNGANLHAPPKEAKSSFKSAYHLPFFIGASYTFWKPYQSAINVAYSPGSTTTAGNVIQARTFAVSGFKVAAGVNTYHDDWIVNINYTWFTFAPRQNSNNLKNNNTINYGSPYFGLPVLSYSTLSSRFSEQFNRIDLLMKKNVSLSDKLIVSPWIGLLGAWDYETLNFDATILFVDDDERGRMNQMWWGIGPYAGARISFDCIQNLALFFSCGQSLLYAEHRIDSDNLLIFSDDDSSQSMGTYQTDFHNVELMVETSMGLKWRKKWEKCALHLHLAWEIQAYLKHNGFLPYFSRTGILGNYAMQGLTVGFQVDY